MRGLGLFLGLSLVAASCGGSEDSAPAPTAEPPPITEADPDPEQEPEPEPEPEPQPEPEPEPEPEPIVAVSDDGELGVSSTTADIDVTVDLLDPADWPPELAGAGTSPGVKIYELGPDGAEFDEPVTVTRRLDLATFDSLELGPRDVPLVVMVVRDADGTYEVLADQSLIRVGDSLYVSGQASHFSDVVFINEGVPLSYLGGGPDGPGPAGELTWEISEFPELDLASLTQLELAAETTAPVSEVLQAPTGEVPILPLGPDALPASLSDTTWFGLADQLLLPPGTDLVIEQVIDDLDLRAIGTTFPDVPVVSLPSTDLLVTDPDAVYEFTVAVLEAAIPADQVDALIEQTLEVAYRPGLSEGTFVLEIFHQAFGEYPSSMLKRYLELDLADGFRAFTMTWDGRVGPDGRLVSFGELVPDGDGWAGQSGIECYCVTQEAILVLDPERADSLPPDATFDQMLDFLEGAAEERLEGVVLAEIAVPGDAPDMLEPLEVSVGPAEGVQFDGPVSFVDTADRFP